jgi:hypothetical protein
MYFHVWFQVRPSHVAIKDNAAIITFLAILLPVKDIVGICDILVTVHKYVRVCVSPNEWSELNDNVDNKVLEQKQKDHVLDYPIFVTKSRANDSQTHSEIPTMRQADILLSSHKSVRQKSPKFIVLRPHAGSTVCLELA